MIAVKEITERSNISVVGLHEHTGSGISKQIKFMSMNNLLNIATPENFPSLKFIDFGGGLKIPYKPTSKKIDFVIFEKNNFYLFRFL